MSERKDSAEVKFWFDRNKETKEQRNFMDKISTGKIRILGVDYLAVNTSWSQWGNGTFFSTELIKAPK